jgi:hypothetical protein
LRRPRLFDRQAGRGHPAESDGSSWLVRNVSSLHSAGAGLLVADGMHILSGHHNDNDQLGIGGNAATGILNEISQQVAFVAAMTTYRRSL